MDIVSHAIMGGIAASPFLVDHPVEASCLMLGTALPDLDALSRLFGKRAFLKVHQTISHSFSVAIICGLACGLFLGPWAGLALALGLLSHALLDVSNTYGITILWPFSQKRFCLEWVFFVDGFVIALNSLALLGVVLSWSWRLGPARWIVPCWLGLLGAYWLFKGLLRSRGARLSPPGTLALIPSMIHPLKFMGVAQESGKVSTFTINALSGRISAQEQVTTYEEQHGELHEGLAEVKIMRSLTPAYHLTEVDSNGQGTTLTWRDLRTRNMSTRFGQVEVDLSPDGAVAEVRFHV